MIVVVGRGDFHFAGIFFRLIAYAGFFFRRNPQHEYFLVDKHYLWTFPSFLTAYMWMTCSKGHSCTFPFSTVLLMGHVCWHVLTLFALIQYFVAFELMMFGT